MRCCEYLKESGLKDVINKLRNVKKYVRKSLSKLF